MWSSELGTTTSAGAVVVVGEAGVDTDVVSDRFFNRRRGSLEMEEGVQGAEGMEFHPGMYKM